MASLTELVASPELRSRLSFVVQPRSPRDVRGVAFAEDLADVANAEPGAIVLLSRAASAAAGSYRFEMALRLGRAHEVAALVMAGQDVGQISATAPAVADRSRTAILATVGRPDLAELAIRSRASSPATRTWRSCAPTPRSARSRRTRRTGGRRRSWNGRAPRSACRCRSVRRARGRAARAVVRRRPGRRLDRRAATRTETSPWASTIVLHAVAAGVRPRHGDRRSAQRSCRSSRRRRRSPSCWPPPQRERARNSNGRATSACPIDGWHVAARVEFEEPRRLRRRRERDGFEQRLGSGPRPGPRSAAGRQRGTARAPASGVVLVRMYRDDPGLAARRAEVSEAVDAARAFARARARGRDLRCGVGGAHPGPAGLLASAAEAKAAVTGRARGRDG